MPEKKKYPEYYLGLDMGTNSVGWAVTDVDYRVMKFNGKAMWGVRLFPEAQDASKRRGFRIARRRIQRRNQRIALLQDVFRDAIMQVDPNFFMRLQEGMLHAEDKSIKDSNNLFNDGGYSDKEYHKTYPTIYHLRSELIHSKRTHDVRLVYLALHHIVKYRGHFLFEGSMDNSDSYDAIIRDLAAEISNTFDETVEISNADEVRNVLCDRNLNKTTKQKKLFTLFSCDKKSKTACLIKAIIGGSVNLKDLFAVTEDDEEKIKIDFGSDKYDEEQPKLQALLGDDYFVIAKAKALHDWTILDGILHGYSYLSDAKVGQYKQHKQDLLTLKKLVRKYVPKAYDEIFVDPETPNNYCAYAGVAKINGKKAVIDKRCTQLDFCKYLRSVLKNVTPKESEFTEAIARINASEFMPKLRTNDNSVVPNQIHLKELEMILKNASTYLSFLNTKDESGFTGIEKIQQILTFRIPYYVGPLNTNDPHGTHQWAKRRSAEKIYPWNFDEIIDRELSATRFITRMTAQCTYLKDCKVLPQNSLLYSKFMVLNELNKITLNGETLPIGLKQNIYNEYFFTHIRASVGGLVNYLKSKGLAISKDDIAGLNGDFHTSLRPWVEMRALMGEYFREDIAEEIIRLSTVLGDDRTMYRQTLNKKFAKVLPASIIEKAAAKRYSGWGKLSAELLTEVLDNTASMETGEYRNIITSMWETNKNLMELLSRDYGFADAIRAHNQNNEEECGYTYDLVRDLYVSPSVKRSIWQTMLIVKEIRKITGHDPRKVFVEVARGDGVKGKQTVSRKSKLLDLYKACKDDSRDWIAEIESRDESDFRSDKLYLYYTQMGRCMYTGEVIDLNRLYDASVYDIDHIHPQSKVKDDSIDNRVLVKRQSNKDKDDVYPIEKAVRERMHDYWSMLLHKEYITKKKYDRLTRSTPLTMDELTDFVARQLVETRQGTKAVAELLQRLMPNTEIVYVKANLVSEFRHDHDMLKCREVNNLHHAKDAYLNIVVGNVYNTKFTKDPRNFFMQRNHEYSLRRMYDFDVRRGNVTAWIKGEQGSIVTIRKMMKKNSILVTKMVFDKKGQLFKTQLVKKCAWQLPMKQGRAYFNDPMKYGGYTDVAGTYFMLVEHTVKGKRIRSVIDMPLHLTHIKTQDSRIIEMLRTEKELVDPVVLFKHIGCWSLFEIDGFRMTITGRGDSRLVYAPAHELVLDYENEKYIRALSKLIERAKNYKKMHNGDEISINKWDEVTVEKNLCLFDTLAQKCTSSIYSTWFKDLGTQLQNKRNEFVSLPTLQQCSILNELIKVFACNRETGNLQELGLTKTAGLLRTRNSLSSYSSARVICQSVTGLFEIVKDMLR